MRFEDLERIAPGIAWREPVGLSVPELGIERLGCRVCIATEGIKGTLVESRGFRTREEFDRHFDEAHLLSEQDDDQDK